MSNIDSEDKNLDSCGCENHDSCGCGDHASNECGDHDSCDCGCDEHENLVVDLEDENGNIVQCEIVDGFNFKDNEYVLVQNPEDGSTYLFKVQGEGESGELIIPEDEEFDEVSAYYEGLSAEEDEED